MARQHAQRDPAADRALQIVAAGNYGFAGVLRRETIRHRAPHPPRRLYGAAFLAYWHKPWAIVGAGAFLAALKFLHDVIE
jgi:hypothetical protein